MDANRRNFMKGLSTGGALLAVGIPVRVFANPPVQTSRQCVLYLEGARADDAFARGAHVACAGLGYGKLPTIRLEGGPMADPGGMIGLLERCRGTRWIALLDDADAAIFIELTRSMGGRLLSMGSHASCGEGAFPLRHVWAAASPAQGAGGILASHFAEKPQSVSIVERFLRPDRGSPASWFAPGFSSHRSVGPEVMHVHCAGLSLAEGCAQLGLPAAAEWTPMAVQTGSCEAVAWQADNWVEAVGHAVAAAALGGGIQESCSSRVFIQRMRGLERALPPERFTSCVVDV